MSKKRGRIASSLDALFDVASEAMEVSRSDSVQTLPIDQIRPDPFQARRLLPGAVRAGFVIGQLDPPGALAAWQALAEDDPREAELLQSQIVSLAASIRQQEMVNPITVFADGRGAYWLETGERRWWAHWWLVSVEELEAFERIRVQIISTPSPERQAAENLQDSPLTAVQEACQIARLLLHLTGRDTDHVVAMFADDASAADDLDDGRTGMLVGYAPYRVALELGRGEVYGKWPTVAQIMDRGERQLLRQLAILKLSDDALNQADRAGLSEGQLRPLASAAPETDAERQRTIVSLVARYDLPGAEVARLIKVPNLEAAEARLLQRQQAKAVQQPKSAPAAIRRPSFIMIERLRKVRRLAARHEKGGLQISDLVEEILTSGQADATFRDLDELTSMLLSLRDQLSTRIGRPA
ncbi:MAG: hypothetical protein GQ526_03170 [Ardenticatenales bacterium]|nr:hypothetical protein [Ardenticatenales bacterium]